PDRGRFRSNRCGRSRISWRAGPGPRKSARPRYGSSATTASARRGRAHKTRTGVWRWDRSARAPAKSAWQATTTPRRLNQGIIKGAPAACEKKSVPSLSGGDRRLAGRQPSAKGGKARSRSPRPRRLLPSYDKVVGLLDKIQNLRHGIPACVAAAFGTYLGGKRNKRVRIRQDVSNGISGKESTRILAGTAWAGTKSGNLCVSGCFRVGLRVFAFFFLPGLALLFDLGGGVAQ